MNKRIKELALEADLITHKVPNGLAHLHTEKDLEKFAELLIRECADIVLKKGMASPDTDFRTGSILLNTYLLGRFGVEE